MFMAFFSWWYGEGWKRQLHSSTTRLAGLLDTFSVDILVRTLFSPFRQISAGPVRGPLDVQIRAVADKLVSRFIGAIVRLAVLIAGSISIFFSVLVAGLYLAVWPLIPFMPLIALLIIASGVLS